MAPSLPASLGLRARGALAKLALVASFPARRSRLAWSTSLLLDRAASLRIGAGSTVLGSGHIVLGAGGSLVIGRRSGVMQGCEIAAGEGASVDIGDDVYIGAYVNIRSSRRITIGHNVRIAQFVSLIGGQYRYASRDRLIREQGFDVGDVTIGDDAWLGVGVVVLTGASVGTGAVVGAGSIVTRDLAPYTIAVGNPARVVGERT